MKKYIVIFLIILVLTAFAAVLSFRGGEEGGRMMSLREYVELNLSELSPEKEVLGGKFYITQFEANDGTGTVFYEDGHNAYIADFTYSIGSNGVIRIESFTVRE